MGEGQGESEGQGEGEGEGEGEARRCLRARRCLARRGAALLSVSVTAYRACAPRTKAAQRSTARVRRNQSAVRASVMAVVRRLR